MVHHIYSQFSSNVWFIDEEHPYFGKNRQENTNKNQALILGNKIAKLFAATHLPTLFLEKTIGQLIN